MARHRSPAKQARTSPRRSRAAPRAPRAPFPREFLWGVGTSAYQVEGAVDEDGRSPSIWDRFCATPGKVADGDTGSVACDSYHRWREDLALMRRLGIRAHRFSVAWPRVLPLGTGAVNQKGLDFYDRLVDELLRAGITPFVTLYHWDLPVALADRGGWLERDVAAWFAEYTGVVARRLADRVKWWMTLNEPSVFTLHGFDNGSHAPGERRPMKDILRIAHNAMRAHALGVQALRAGVPDGRVGWALSTQICCPASDAPGDVDAARLATLAMPTGDLWKTSWWNDPVLEGRYPEDGLRVHHADMPAGWEADLASMRQPVDYLGINLYGGYLFRAGADGAPELVRFPPGHPRSGVKWQRILPSVMYWGPRHYHQRFGLPIVVAENGMSSSDWIFLDGQVHDAARVDYLHRALLELSRAVRDGVPVQGYYHWSLLDNFEWAEGFTQRFGLVHVNFATQRRTPKDSFELYRKVIATGGRALLGRTRVPAAIVR
jgi:beta-glucosidase